MISESLRWSLECYDTEKYNFHLGRSHFLLLVQRRINLGRDLESSSLKLIDESPAVLGIVDLVHRHHLEEQHK